MEAALVSATASCSPFDVTLGPLGSFPATRGNRGQAIWISVGSNVAELIELAATVESALVQAGLQLIRAPLHRIWPSGGSGEPSRQLPASPMIPIGLHATIKSKSAR
jgi:hypothetical protein